MKLYVMRHGTAEDESADGDDATRALTAPGRDRVRDVARMLASSGEAPRRIVSSPLVRALQTAEIVEAHAKVEQPVEINTSLSPRGPALSFVRDAAKQGKKRLMVVGHEPDLSILVASLIGRPLHVSFGKAMVVSLHVPGDESDATLRFILDPKSLQLVDDARASSG